MRDDVIPSQHRLLQLNFSFIYSVVRYPRPKDHTAAVCGDFIYVIGGTDCPYSMEALDTKTQTWTKLPDIPSRCRASAACSHNGFIYVYGGFDLYLKIESNNRFCIFNCATGQWLDFLTKDEFKPQCKRSHHTLTECNGLLVAIGGSNGYKSISDTDFVAMALHSTASTSKPTAAEALPDGLPAHAAFPAADLPAAEASSPIAETAHEIIAAAESSKSVSTSCGPVATIVHLKSAASEASSPSARSLSLKERLSVALASSKSLLNTAAIASESAPSAACSHEPNEKLLQAQTPLRPL